MHLILNSTRLLAKNFAKISLAKNFSIVSSIRFQELKYTDKHEWIRLNGNIGTIGITDYAQDKLGEVVYVELPEVGTKFEQSGSR